MASDALGHDLLRLHRHYIVQSRFTTQNGTAVVRTGGHSSGLHEQISLLANISVNALSFSIFVTSLTGCQQR